MSPKGSVTYWLGELQAGNPVAAQALWDRYFGQLVRLARQKLQQAPRRIADEEDVALSAFASFCRQVERNRFPQLQDRHNLWQLLVVITARKAAHLIRDAGREKRGGLLLGNVSVPAVEEIIGAEPTPAFAAEVAEEYQRRLAQLGDADLQTVALAKLEGYTNEEIAARLGCALRSIERRLKLIRTIWEKEMPG
jgi:DNA-directed RNA polymerase specialized sigma24 family protein